MKDKILEGYLDDFASQFGFEQLEPASCFTHFINYCMLSRLTSDPYEIVDINVDGRNDTGIDGLHNTLSQHCLNDLMA